MEAKVKANKVDTSLECEDYEQYKEVALEFEGFDSSLDTGERVTKFVLAFVPFLGVESWTFSFDLRFSK